MCIQRTFFPLILVLSRGVVAVAQPIFFGDPITSDTLIDAGNPYTRGFGAYDAGAGSPTVEVVEGGQVGGWAFLYNETRLLMSGGNVIATVGVADNATFTMTGGSVGRAPSPIYEWSDIVGSGSSSIHIHGGQLGSGLIELYDSTTLHVYGVGLNLQLYDDQRYYFLAGMLQDGGQIVARGTLALGASVFVHNVPEPSTWLMSTVVSFILQRQRILPRVAPSC